MSTVQQHSPAAPAVGIYRVSKRYDLYRTPSELLLQWLPGQDKTKPKTFDALKEISLQVARGEFFALVGPNGSGKSTLLQIVSKILEPTSGQVVVRGRVAAILELGAGFNPEFTGRENVVLNAELLGLSGQRLQEVFPKIEEFAGIGEFIDRPVKEYSSGMYIRLAFSTAIHVDPEVLIVDEALAVGDAIFANRCIHKLEELKERGVTILFVSHDLGLVKRLADRAALLLQGEVAALGRPADVVNKYVGLVHELQLRDQPEGGESKLAGSYRHGDGKSQIEEILIRNEAGEATNAIVSGTEATICLQIRFRDACEDPMVGILIRNRLGIDVFGTNTRVEGVQLGAVKPGQLLHIRFHLPFHLSRQEYTLTVAAQNPDGSSQDWIDDAISFTIIDPKDTAGLLQVPTRIVWEVE